MIYQNYYRYSHSKVLKKIITKRIVTRQNSILHQCTLLSSNSNYYSNKKQDNSRCVWNDKNGSKRKYTNTIPLPPPQHPKNKGFSQVLNQTQRDLIKEIKRLSVNAKELSQNINCTDEYPSIGKVPFLEDVKDSTFVLVVAGEFNSGKSTFVNAILGEELLKSGPLPTTDCLTILTHDDNSNNNNEESTKETTNENNNNNAVSIHKHKSKLLRDITLIDTPGTNTATFFHHTEKTLQLLPCADLVFFITSAERPLTASEMELLDYLKQYKKQMVLILNKIDLLENLGSPSSNNYGKDVIEDVVQYVKERFPGGVVIPISAKNALTAKVAVQQELKSNNTMENIVLPKYGACGPMYDRSNFSTFETYLQNTLSSTRNKHILPTKLSSPLGIADGVLTNIKQSIIQPTLQTLQKDKQTLHLLDNQMTYFKNELVNSWKLEALPDIEQELQKESLRIDKIIVGYYWYEFVCMNRKDFYDNIWKKYSTRYSDNIIPDILDEHCESTLVKARSQSHAISDYLGKRPILSYQNIIGSPITSPTNIQQQLDILQISFKKQLLQDECNFISLKEKHDHIVSNELFQKLRMASIGGSLCFTSSIITSFYTYFEYGNAYLPLYYQGSLVGSATILSYLIYHTTIKSCISYYHQHVQQNYTTIYQQNMINISTRHISKIFKRLNDSISPYVRYVNSEHDRMEAFETECNDLLIESSMLRQRVLDSCKN